MCSAVKCLAIEVGSEPRGEDVVDVLEQLVAGQADRQRPRRDVQRFVTRRMPDVQGERRGLEA